MLHGAQSGGSSSRPGVPIEADADEPKRVAGDSAVGVPSPPNTNFSTTRHSAPRMHIEMPTARNMARHMGLRSNRSLWDAVHRDSARTSGRASPFGSFIGY